jgi:hypothetical protein
LLKHCPNILQEKFTMPVAVAERIAPISPARADLTLLARESLERHPHFRGRTAVVGIEQRGAMLRLTGKLPTFYLKQMVQETLRHIPGVQGIRNEIMVVSAAGERAARPMF